MPKNTIVDDETVTSAMRDTLGLLTVPQVAKLLQVSRDWVYDNAKAGKLPCRKIGGNLRFRPAELDDYLSGRWTPPASG